MASNAVTLLDAPFWSDCVNYWSSLTMLSIQQ